jgi:hypothetical protein
MCTVRQGLAMLVSGKGGYVTYKVDNLRLCLRCYGSWPCVLLGYFSHWIWRVLASFCQANALLASVGLISGAPNFLCWSFLQPAQHLTVKGTFCLATGLQGREHPLITHAVGE